MCSFYIYLQSYVYFCILQLYVLILRYFFIFYVCFSSFLVSIATQRCDINSPRCHCLFTWASAPQFVPVRLVWWVRMSSCCFCAKLQKMQGAAGTRTDDLKAESSRLGFHTRQGLSVLSVHVPTCSEQERERVSVMSISCHPPPPPPSCRPKGSRTMSPFSS